MLAKYLKLAPTNLLSVAGLQLDVQTIKVLRHALSDKQGRADKLPALNPDGTRESLL